MKPENIPDLSMPVLVKAFAKNPGETTYLRVDEMPPKSLLVMLGANQEITYHKRFWNGTISLTIKEKK